MHPNNLPSQNDSKYNNMRTMLLAITILSAISIPYIFFMEKYFVLSSYLTQCLSSARLVYYQETSLAIYPIVASVMAVLSVVPYLLCWIFSKKRVGWMIGALVLFSLDTLLLLVDFIPMLLAGETSFLIDTVFHILGIVYLSLAVKYGFAKKNEQLVLVQPNIQPDGSALSQETESYPETLRELTIVRKKSFMGCAIPIVCMIDGKEVCRIKNGGSAVVTIPSRIVLLNASFSNNLAAGMLTIPAGEDKFTCQLSVKTGLVANTIEITPIANT